MKNEPIKEFIKYGKFIIYLVLSIIMVILALFLFRYSNTIYNTLYRTPEFINVEVEFYYLFIFMILLLVIPFTTFFILAVVELSNLMAQLKNKILNQQSADPYPTTANEEITEEEKAKSEEERIALLEKKYKEKEKNIIKCLKENTQKIKNPKKISKAVLSCIGKFYEITQGELYLKQPNNNNKEKLVLSATYAYFIPEEKIFEFEIGEGLVGQVAKQGELINLDNIPEGYITISSGLGNATPNNMIIFPIVSKKKRNVLGVVEIAAFKPFDKYDIRLLKNIGEEAGKYFENIEITDK